MNDKAAAALARSALVHMLPKLAAEIERKDRRRAIPLHRKLWAIDGPAPKS